MMQHLKIVAAVLALIWMDWVVEVRVRCGLLKAPGIEPDF